MSTVAPTQDPSAHFADPHGEAALSLAESMLHWLVARSVMTHADAHEVLQIASDALAAAHADRMDDAIAPPKAVVLLSAISASLAIDAPDDGKAVTVVS